MARPDCPRCGSDLVAVAVPDSPSEWVEELRGGSVHAHPVTLGETSWLCRVCGYRWQPPPDAEPADLEQGSLDERNLKHGDGQERELKHGRPGKDPEQPEQRDLEQERLADEPDQPPMRQFAELLKLGPERSFVTAGGETTLKNLPDPRRRRSIVGALMALASLAVVVVLALQAPRSSPLSDLPEPTDAAANAGGPAPATPSPSPEPDRRGVRAVLDVEQPCWVRVIADGEFVDEVTLQPGDSPVYRAKRDLQLRLGNAGGVTLRVNGEPIQTGPPGEVTTITLSWRDGDLHVERVTLS
jgi:RodZ C-terminal domain